MLVIVRLQLRTNECGIEQVIEADFRPAAGGEYGMAGEGRGAASCGWPLGVKGNYGSQGRQEGRLLVGFAEPEVGPVAKDSVAGTERTICMAA